MDKYTVLPISWALLIAVLCGIPGNEIPRVSLLEIISFDKWVHAALFFVLIILCLRAYAKKKSVTSYIKIYLFIAGVCYGVILEVLQSIVFIDRSTDIFDVVANSFGCFMAVFLFSRLIQIKVLKTFF